jgi:hypothetical protein
MEEGYVSDKERLRFAESLTERLIRKAIRAETIGDEVASEERPSSFLTNLEGTPIRDEFNRFESGARSVK